MRAANAGLFQVTLGKNWNQKFQPVGLTIKDLSITLDLRDACQYLHIFHTDLTNLLRVEVLWYLFAYS